MPRIRGPDAGRGRDTLNRELLTPRPQRALRAERGWGNWILDVEFSIAGGRGVAVGWGFDGRADGPRRPIEWFRFERLSVSIGASRMMRPTGELLMLRPPRPLSPDTSRGADAERTGGGGIGFGILDSLFLISRGGCGPDRSAGQGGKMVLD